MSEVIFDTSIVIDALNDIGPAKAEFRRAKRGWISRISWIEVLAGGPSAALQETEFFLRRFGVIEVTEEIGRRAADIRRTNKRLKLPDAIIWASAQVSGRILVTRNSKDFPAQMPGIRIPYTL
jgi:predicted nucleic acid-binding protein